MFSTGAMLITGVVGALALAPGVSVASSVAAAAEPGPDTDTSRFENATVQTGLSISIDRAGDHVVVGVPTRYTVVVDNPGSEPASATVRASLPPQLGEVAGGDGELGDGYLDWQVTVAPQSATTLRLSGSYAADERGAAGPDRVALTACVLGEDGQPVVCATDLAEVAAPESTPWWWWAAGGAAALAAVLAGAWLLARWRRRRRPAPAHAAVLSAHTVRVPGEAAAPEPGVNSSSSSSSPGAVRDR